MKIMRKEDAIKLKADDHILTIGTDKVIECVVEHDATPNGSVNVHDVDNQGHYYRTYDEIFPLTNKDESIDVMFWRQKYQAVGELYEELVDECFEFNKLNIFEKAFYKFFEK